MKSIKSGAESFQDNDLLKYYFIDIELINFFKKNKYEIKLIPVKFKISDKSSIKFFAFKNLKIILEFFRVLNKIDN